MISYVNASLEHLPSVMNSSIENIGADDGEGDGGGVSEAEKEKVVAVRSEEDAKLPSVFFPVDIENLRKRVFNFYPRNGKPFKSVLPDFRYSEVVGRR